MADILKDYNWKEFLNQLILTKQLLELEAMEEKLNTIPTRNINDVHECSSKELMNEQINLNEIEEKFKITNDSLHIKNVEPQIIVKRDVFIHCHVIKLGEIDTINEKFNSELIVYSRWFEPQLMPNKKEWIGENFKSWSSYWNPKITITNGFNSLEESVRYQIVDKNGETYVEEVRYIKGLFAETLELQEYPFDEQELSVRISTELPETEVRLLSNPKLPSLLNVGSFSDRQQWHLDEELVVSHGASKCDLFAEKSVKHPVLNVTCRVTRKSQFFIWNIILIMMCICSLAFSVFTIPFDTEFVRINLTIILLLSNVTFKTVVSKTIPKVSYLTFMDKYIYASMIIIISMAVWHAIMHKLRYNVELAAPLDKIMLAIFAGIYISFNVVCVISINCCTAASKRRNKSKVFPENEHNKIL